MKGAAKKTKNNSSSNSSSNSSACAHKAMSIGKACCCAPCLCCGKARGSSSCTMRMVFVVLAVFAAAFFVLIASESFVAISEEPPTFPIDAVITWVDGDDDEWFKMFVAAAKEEHREVDMERVPVAHQFKHDELYYNIRALGENAPWLRQVFVATQRPHMPHMLEELRALVPFPIKVVHHDEFIPKEFLPTFESSWIEMFLDCIPGISERFLYFNDDVFAVRPLKPQWFFTKYGEAIIPTEPIDDSPFSCYVLGLEHSCEKHNGRRHLHKWFMRAPLHSVHPLTRDMVKYFRDELGPETIDTICRHRTRTRKYSFPAMWTMANTGHPTIRLVYISPYSTRFYQKLWQVKPFPWSKTGMTRAHVICMNVLTSKTPHEVLEALYGQLRDWIIPEDERATFEL